jgi:hypothetical protein
LQTRGILLAVAVAIKQAVLPSYLLQPAQWQPQGWSVVRRAVIKPVPGDDFGRPIIAIRVEAFEWTDVQGFGIGNTDNALAQLQQQIQQRGSDLYAYTLLRRDVFNFLGIRAFAYRLVLLHSIVELVEFAVLILAIGFAAIIFLQYTTSGHSPLLQDLQSMWNTGVTSAGNAVGQAVGGLASPFIWATLFAGTIAIAFAVAQKSAGVKAPIPKGPSIGATVKTKHLNVGTR